MTTQAAPPMVKIEVPVKQVGDHLVTVIEQGFGWFYWLNSQREDGTPTRLGGYVSGEFALREGAVASKATDTRTDRERLLKAMSCRQTPIRWERIAFPEFGSGREFYFPVFAFDHAAFVEGLARCMEKGYGRGGLSQIQYQGDGDWDIDAGGGDLVLQAWLFEDLVFS